MELGKTRENLKVIVNFLLLFFLLQILFWYKIESIKPNLGIVPDLPSKHAARALSLGEEEFYFRVKGLRLQNAGDTFGRVTPLKNYDYKKLYQWFSFLDTINPRSHYIPALAGNYYSNSQNPEDSRYIVKYLEEHYDFNPEGNWWWLYQAIYLATYKLKDQDLTMRLAYKLAETSGENAPTWTKQMAAIMHSKFGQHCESLRVINNILNEYESGKSNISDEDINFMLYFINNRLKAMKEEGFDPKSCDYTMDAEKNLKLRDEKKYRDPRFKMKRK
ncbi:hypothetical protein ACFL0U_03630 [Pseudomonadota bacterium]